MKRGEAQNLPVDNADLADRLALLEAENVELRRCLEECKSAEKQAEADLRGNGRRFQSMIENSLDAAYQRNLKTDRYEYLNPIIERVLGWPVEDLLSADIQTILTKIHPQDVPAVEQEILRSEAECRKSGHGSGWLEYRFCDKEGRYHWIVDQITVLPDAEGQPLYCLGSVRDVTEKKQAQDALQQSEENYRVLFETMAQGVVYHDKNGRIISANPAAERMIGLTLDQMRGLTSTETRWRTIHEDGSDFPGEEHPLPVALRTKKPVIGVPIGTFNVETQSYHWMLVSAIPQFQPGEDEPYQVFATFEEFTERKRVEETLRESEERYRLLFQYSMEGLLVTVPDGRIMAANAAACQIFGRMEEEICQVGRNGLVDATDPRVAAALAERERTGHFATQMTFIRGDGTRFEGEVTSSVYTGKDGLVRTSMIVRDISERQWVAENLRKSKERYRSLFNGITEGFALLEVLWDKNGDACDYRYLDINPSFERLTGLSREDVIGKKRSEVFPDEDLDLLQTYAEVGRTGQPAQFEHHSEALKSWYEVFAFCPTPGQAAVLFMETTQRKQADEERERLLQALEAERVRWQTTVDTIPVMVAVSDLEGKIIYLNPTGQALMQRIGWPLMDRLHPVMPTLYRVDGTPLAQDELPIYKAVSQNQTIQNDETMLIATSGEKMYILWNAAPMQDAEGQVVGGIGVGRDISSLVEIEQKLRETNQRLNTVLNSMTDVYYVLDSEWRFVVVNPVGIEKFYQRPASELLGNVIWEIYPGALNTEIERQYRRAVAENQPVHFEVHSVIRNAWYEAHAYPLNGRLEVYLRDITQRVLFEEKITDLARFPEQNPNPILRVEASGTFLFGNRASQRMCDEWGFRVGQPVSPGWLVLVTEIIASQQNSIIDARCGEKIYSLTLVPFAEAGYVNIYAQDVTGRVINDLALQKARDELELRVQARTEELLIANKRLQVEAATRLLAEETLRLANAYNRSLIETSLDPLMTIGLDGMVSDVNAATELVTGRTREELIGTDFYRYFTDPNRAVSAYRDVLLNGSVSDTELEFKHTDGRLTPVDFNAAVYRDTSGNVIGVFAAARDISQRKQAEQQIRIQTTALEAAANGVVITDPQGAILWSNPAFAQISGYSYADTLGQNPRIFQSGQVSVEVFADLWQTVLSGKVWQGDIINRHKDGSIYIEENTITPVLDGSGAVSHFIAIKQDVTERKHSELELVRLNRAQKLLSECNALLIHSEEEEGLLVEICRLIIETGGYRMAWVGVTEQDPAQSIRPVACFGEENGYLMQAQISWGENERGQGPSGIAFRSGTVQINQDFRTNAIMEFWRDLALEHGYQASIALPLKNKNETFAVLAIYAATSDAFNPEEAGLLARLADEISFGINALRERAERARAQEEARRWMHIFEHAEWGVEVGSADGTKIEQINSAFARMHGYSVDELTGKPIAQMYPPEARLELAQHIRLSEELGHYVYEADHVRKDGSIFPVEVDVTVVKDDTGQVLYRAVNVQDVTERKAAERNIQQQEALLSAVLDTLPVGVWIADANGTIFRSNPAGLNIWEGARYVEPEELGVYKAWRVGTKEPIAAEQGALWRAVKNGETILNEELEIECFDGTHKFIINSAIPLFDAEGHVTSGIVVNQDITERMRVEQALEVERQQLLILSQAERNQRLFAESLAQATVALSSSLDLNEVLDRILDQIELVVPFDAATITLIEGDIVHTVRTRGFEKRPELLANYTSGAPLEAIPQEKEILKYGKPLVYIVPVNDAGYKAVPGWEWAHAYIGIPLQTGESVLGSLNMFYSQAEKAEKERIEHLTAFANQASIAIQNANLYKELENALAQEHALRTRLIQTEKFAAMGRLLASVAHELNNPLQTIKNCLFLTRQDTPPDSPIQEYLDMAFSETARLSKLVAQLRELYRPRVDNVVKPNGLYQLVDEVHSLLNPHLIHEKVGWMQEPGCEDVLVKCNVDQIKQVLINICMNGIEAMQHNGGTLTVGLRVSQETNMVGVDIRDTGSGIPPEVMRTLFEPFTTTKSSGLGLGLSICYELIQRHRGQITVDTQFNQGTTFTIWLPLLQVDNSIQE